jgi:hypothetical protein
MKQRAIRSLRIALAALAVGILSVAATNSEAIIQSGPAGLGLAIWVTVFVTYPAFAVFIGFSVIAIVWWYKLRQTQNG